MASEPPETVLDERSAGLQRLVDKFQDKTEKEISRTLKVKVLGSVLCAFAHLSFFQSIEYDRRMAKGLPELDLDQGVQNEIIDLILSEDSQSKRIMTQLNAVVLINDLPGDARKFSCVSRDKLVGQIGITYGVLRRLGISEEIVMKCLRGAAGVELEHAFDWVRRYESQSSFVVLIFSKALCALLG